MTAEKYIRSKMFDTVGFRPAMFDPTQAKHKDIPAPLVVDITYDVTNTTKIYHKNTTTVREMIAKCDLVTTDTQAMCSLVGNYTNGYVFPFQYGMSTVKDSDALGGGVQVGILNHNADTKSCNLMNINLLKALDRKLLLFGDPIDGLECEVIDELDKFASYCDILVLPGDPHLLHSITVPVYMMSSETIIVARNVPGYYELQGSAGVQLLDTSSIAIWKDRIARLESDQRRMISLKASNVKRSEYLSTESLRRLSSVLNRLVEFAEDEKSIDLEPIV